VLDSIYRLEKEGISKGFCRNRKRKGLSISVSKIEYRLRNRVGNIADFFLYRNPKFAFDMSY